MMTINPAEHGHVQMRVCVCCHGDEAVSMARQGFLTLVLFAMLSIWLYVGLFSSGQHSLFTRHLGTYFSWTLRGNASPLTGVVNPGDLPMPLLRGKLVSSSCDGRIVNKWRRWAQTSSSSEKFHQVGNDTVVYAAYFDERGVNTSYVRMPGLSRPNVTVFCHLWRHGNATPSVAVATPHVVKHFL